MSDTLIAQFNPGDSQVNVSMPIIVDHIFEPHESLMFILAVPRNISDNLFIKQGINNIAKGEIVNSGKVVKLIKFTYVHNCVFITFTCSCC